jgi:hypothetical protein
VLGRVPLLSTDVSDERISSQRASVTSNVVNSQIPVILIMEAICSFETFLIRATRSNIPEDVIIRRNQSWQGWPLVSAF